VTRLSANQDGSKVLFGETSWLFNSDGSGRLQLAWAGCASEVLKWGTHRPVMNSDATRFAYLDPRPDGMFLAGGQPSRSIPLNLGLAPTLSDLSATPPVRRHQLPIFDSADRAALANQHAP
jgi:hypothetical protein